MTFVVNTFGMIVIGIVVFVLGRWFVARMRKKVVKEKLSSFGFVLGTIINVSVTQFDDPLKRIEYIARNLSSINGKIDKDELLLLVRAASLLHVLRLVVFNEDGPILSELGGESVRFLGVSVAGAGESHNKQQAIAETAIQICKIDIGLEQLLDELSRELNRRYSNADGNVELVMSDVVNARLIIERAILDRYARTMNVKFMDEPGLKSAGEAIWPA